MLSLPGAAAGPFWKWGLAITQHVVVTECLGGRKPILLTVVRGKSGSCPKWPDCVEQLEQGPTAPVRRAGV